MCCARSDFQRLKKYSKMFARAAFCDVTPRERPVQLAGYAQRRTASTILDPIEISALLLESDGCRCLILSFDLMIVGSELQNIVLSRLASLGFRPDEVMLLASHTHNAPATDRACGLLGTPDLKFVNDAADAAEELVRRIEREFPARVSLDIFRGRLNHAINRRRYWPFPTFSRAYGFKWRSVVLSPNPSGPRDEDATVVVLRKINDSKSLAVLWHYACHPTAAAAIDVVSADYPGAVRRLLRGRFGDTPCVFAQGFCGDVRPNVTPSSRKFRLRERLNRIARIVASGNLFPAVTSADLTAWSQSLAAAVGNIVKGDPATSLSPECLSVGSASIPIDRFFTGSVPDKILTSRIVKIGHALEIVVLSAEPTVEWIRILEGAVPRAPQQLRLYVGYLGSVFGYLPTAAQVAEGGYEVEGFQPLFGLSGHFESSRIEEVVSACVKSAFGDAAHKRPCEGADAENGCR